MLAWAHNETSTGVMVPVLRPADAGDALVRDRRHLRRRRAAGRRLGRPTPTTSRRRRASPPTAGCGWRCSARPPRSGSPELDAVRALDPAFLSLQHCARELAQGPDLQHARRRHAVPARRPDPLDARRRRPRLVRGAHAAPPRSTSTGGPSAPPTRRPFVERSRASARWSSARSTSTRASTPRRSPRRCAPTASSTPSPTASSAATSCGSACSRRSSPRTCRR